MLAWGGGWKWWEAASLFQKVRNACPSNSKVTYLTLLLATQWLTHIHKSPDCVQSWKQCEAAPSLWGQDFSAAYSRWVKLMVSKYFLNYSWIQCTGVEAPLKELDNGRSVTGNVIPFTLSPAHINQNTSSAMGSKRILCATTTWLKTTLIFFLCINKATHISFCGSTILIYFGSQPWWGWGHVHLKK